MQLFPGGINQTPRNQGPYHPNLRRATIGAAFGLLDVKPDGPEIVLAGGSLQVFPVSIRVTKGNYHLQGKTVALTASENGKPQALGCAKRHSPRQTSGDSGVCMLTGESQNLRLLPFSLLGCVQRLFLCWATTWA